MSGSGCHGERSLPNSPGRPLLSSGAWPLIIKFGLYMNACWDEHANSCLDALITHSHRWKSATLQLSSGGLQKPAVVKHILPFLERLDIRETDSDFDAVLDASKVAPRLHSLHTDMLPNVLKVPWDQLEYFHGLGHGQKQSLDCFRQCPNLVECKVLLYYRDGDLG